MAIPHKCPVCEGAGTTTKPPYVAGDQETWYASDCRFPCPACKGTCIVWEKEITIRKGELKVIIDEGIEEA